MPARQRELHYLRNEVRQKESENVQYDYRTEVVNSLLVVRLP
jgi:hypothetical protein